MRLLGLVLFVAVLQLSEPAKILSVLPVAVRSHGILYDRLMKELAKRGHEITFITPYKSKIPTENIKEIIIPDFKEKFMSGAIPNVNHMAFAGSLLPWLLIIPMPIMTYKNVQMILDVPEVQNLVESDTFDLVFGEPYMDEALLAGFAYKSKAPIIALSTFMPNFWSSYAVGNPAPSSYIPEPFLPYTSNMNFFQRLHNLIFGFVMEFQQRISMCLSNTLLRQYFGDDVPHLDDIVRNISLVLVNHHLSLSFPHPQLPNIIDVAGMHIYPPKPLPKDLKEYMDNAKKGVILFSLGTNVKSSDLGEDTIRNILEAFSQLDQDVIWKFEKQLEGLPKNVKIAEWLPQSDILAHKNLKLFITHGGLLSTTEAAYFGVPLVGIPVMADQPINVKQAENAGIAVALNLNTLTSTTLLNAVREVLNNPKYRETAQLRSKVLHDTMSSPLETAVWWIEYVIRHNGAPHLRSASQDLYWFQLHQVDTIAAFLLLVAAGFYLQLWIVRKIWRRLFSKVNKKEASKSKKNK